MLLKLLSLSNIADMPILSGHSLSCRVSCEDDDNALNSISSLVDLLEEICNFNHSVTYQLQGTLLDESNALNNPSGLWYKIQELNLSIMASKTHTRLTTTMAMATIFGPTKFCFVSEEQNWLTWPEEFTMHLDYT